MPILMQGTGQMTPAQQTTLRKAQPSRNGGGKRPKKTTAKTKKKAAGKKAAGVARAAVKRAVGQRLVKGSAAAKAYMAKIRKLRKK